MTIVRQYTLDNQTNPVAMFLERRDKYNLDPPVAAPAARNRLGGERRVYNVMMLGPGARMTADNWQRLPEGDESVNIQTQRTRARRHAEALLRQ